VSTASWRRRAALAALAAGVAASAFGCETLVGIHDRSVADASVPTDVDASSAVDAAATDVDASSATGADATTCNHAEPPAAPLDVEGGSADLDLIFAANSLDLGVRFDGGAPSLVGYDLDGLCTCPDPPSCAPVDPDDMHCDQPGGRDTAINGVFETFAVLSGGTFDPTAYSEQVQAGTNGLLVRVQNYDGSSNDTNVAVSVYLSTGTVDPDGGVGHAVPRWDGTDLWALDSESVVTNAGGTAALPVHFDVDAYVANGVLVARTDFPILLYAGPATGTAVLDGTNMVLTATLTALDGGGYALADGMIAGRVPVARVPLGMSGVISGDAGFICPGSSEYDALKLDVCRAADLPSVAGAVDAAATCDALGFGMAFAAVQASLGPIATRTPSGSPCADAGPATCD
jgi:hypothetical protein